MAYEYSSRNSDSSDDIRPAFHIGQHDSSRVETLANLQYGQVLNSGVSAAHFFHNPRTGLTKRQFQFVTTPITNAHFHERIVKLVDESLSRAGGEQKAGSHIEPIVTPLTPEDTALFPEVYTSGFIGYASPWIDLCSPNHVIASVSRQVFNLEVDYANFCGIRSIIVPGPRQDSAQAGNGRGIAQYARAIQEALLIGTRVNFVIHLPMYREPGLEEKVAQLSISKEAEDSPLSAKEIDIFTSWDSWHVIRTVCDYSARLLVGKCPSELSD